MRVRFPRALARANRHITNPVMGLWAPYLLPLAVVLHHGRKSGHAYRTPVLAFRRDDQIVIALFYGETDWLRNVLAADRARIERLGRTWAMTNPRVVTSEHAEELPAGTRWTARVLGMSMVADLVDESPTP